MKEYKELIKFGEGLPNAVMKFNAAKQTCKITWVGERNTVYYTLKAQNIDGFIETLSEAYKLLEELKVATPNGNMASLDLKSAIRLRIDGESSGIYIGNSNVMAIKTEEQLKIFIDKLEYIKLKYEKLNSIGKGINTADDSDEVDNLDNGYYGIYHAITLIMLLINWPIGVLLLAWDEKIKNNEDKVVYGVLCCLVWIVIYTVTCPI